MADISKVVLLDGQEYDIKDAGARTSLESKIDSSEKGIASGVATLDSNGDVPVSQLPEFVGATSSAAGTAGIVPAPTTSDADKFLSGDGTWVSGGRPMVILSYGSSTWSDFLAAYNNNVIVYCRASSNSNPATGSQTRMAFMAYVNDATNPTNVEFQYYRSVNAHSSTQMGDQVFVYKLDKNSGWSVTTREASIKQIKAATNTPLSVSWSSNVVTLTNTMTADDMPMSSSDATTTKAAIEALNATATESSAGLMSAADKTKLNSGVAELDSAGKVLSSQLPSYVDDVIEYDTYSEFPVSGESGKIYIDKQTNKTYRWTGTVYCVIGSDLALGETSSTAYRGDRGKTAYDHAVAKGSAFASGFYKFTTNSEGHITDVLAVQKSDITILGIPGTAISNEDIDLLFAPDYKNRLNAQYIITQVSSQSLLVEQGSVTNPSIGGGNSDYVQFGQYFPAGTYTMSCKVSGEGISDARFLCSTSFSGGTYNAYYGGYFADMTNGQITITASEGFGVGFVFKTGTEDSEGVIYDIMFEEGDTAHAYKSYIPVNCNHTPYPETHTDNDVTFTRNSDWSITATGTQTGNIFFPAAAEASNRFELPTGTYTLTGGFNALISVGCLLYTNKTDASPYTSYVCGPNDAVPVTFTVANDCWACVRIVIASNATGVDGKRFYIMLNEGNVALPYTKPII